MDYSNELDPTSTNSPSTRSGHQPGTPKPPFDPPRRRSSLHFSKVFSCSPPRDTSDETESQDTPVSPRKMDLTNSSTTTPSNTGRRRAPLSVNADVTPGHVAQMQKLFQSAKASLRMDMAFAASPNGSIGSRLPPIRQSPPSDRTVETPTPADANQKWRYSTAPGILLGLDRDVREPVPEASPALPELQSSGPELSFTAEPLSSGFNSPADTEDAEPKETDLVYDSSPPANTHSPQNERVAAPTVAEIQGRITCLRVAAENEYIDAGMDESPLVAHVKRLSAADIPLPASRHMSAEIEDTMLTDLNIVEAATDDEIFLSEPAKAAAESAKVKRGILRSFFFPRHTGKDKIEQQGTPESSLSANAPSERFETPCPDPKLHELFSRRTCPDPAAHLTDNVSAAPMMSTLPEAAIALAQGSPAEPSHMGPMYALQPPMPHYQRATATGSPMAFPKFKSPPPSPPLPYRLHQPTRAPERPFSPPPPHKALQRSDYPELNSEHFQPGWYYTRAPAGPPSTLNPMTYSFSTAAAKSVGQSAAPDSRIRDSYRTDTLTPLAKPPSRYRKTSITAMASTRGVGKYYGDTIAGNSQATRSGMRRSHHRSGVQFRSSPPLQPADMAPGINKRRRPKDLEDENLAREDESQVMELDDDTRAAIRMSLFGSETPEMLHARESLRELSPNVSTMRKDRRQHKKRRPSYWDGDLKEVKNSLAARDTEGKVQVSALRGSVREGAERQVMTSPPKEGVESLKSEQVEIEGRENVSVRNSLRDRRLSYDIGNDDVSMTGEGDGTMLAIERDMN